MKMDQNKKNNNLIRNKIKINRKTTKTNRRQIRKILKKKMMEEKIIVHA